MTAYTPDTFYCPITIDSTNNVIVITEDPGGTPTVITVTVDAGTYYLHDDSSFHATAKGLLHTIKTLLNSGTTAGLGTRSGTPANTYAWSVATPSSSTGLTNNGLKLSSTTSTDYEITWTGATTMLPEWFGGVTAAFDDASVTSGGDEIITWARATRYRMCTRDILDISGGGTGCAVTKIRTYYKDVRWSSQRPSDSVAVVWDEGYFRDIVYEDVPGVEVYRERSGESEWAGTTDRATGDGNATWYDVWDALAVGGTVLVVHNSTSDLQIDTHAYESVRFWEPTPWDQFAQQLYAPGDYYRISLRLWADPDASDYDH